jgi:hypothetical protein
MLSSVFCSRLRFGQRGTSAFEVALSLALGALLVVPVSFLLARFSSRLEENSLSLEGAAVLQTWLDALQISDIEEGYGNTEVRFGENLWLLSWRAEEAALSMEPNGSTSEAFVLVVAHARNGDHAIEVTARRLVVEPFWGTS